MRQESKTQSARFGPFNPAHRSSAAIWPGYGKKGSNSRRKTAPDSAWPRLARYFHEAAAFLSLAVSYKARAEKVKTRRGHEMPRPRGIRLALAPRRRRLFFVQPEDYNSPACTKCLPNCSPGCRVLMASRAPLREDLLFIPGNARGNRI